METLTPKESIKTPSHLSNHAMLHHSVSQLACWLLRLAIRVVKFSKLERFLHKNQHPQRKSLNFENWISGGLRSFKNQSSKNQLFSSSHLPK